MLIGGLFDVRSGKRRGPLLGGGGGAAPRALNVVGGLWPLAQLVGTTVAGESNYVRLRNRSGKTLTNVTVDYGNAYMQVAGDVTTTLDTLILNSAVAYPAVTDVTRLATEEAIAPGEVKSFTATGLSIPPGAMFYICTDVRPLNTDGRYPTAYLGAGTISVSDRGREVYLKPDGVPQVKAAAGIPLTGASTANIYTPLSVRSTDHSNFSVAVLGDSWVQGSGDGTNSGDITTGIYGRATSGLYPYLALGYAGAEVRNHSADGKLFQRLGILERGITHAIVEWGINDTIASGSTLASIQGHLTTIAQRIADLGVKPIAHTIGPRTSSTDNWATVENQTPSAGYVAGPNGLTGASSDITAALNDWLLTVPAPFHDVVDIGNALMSAPNSNRWGVYSDGTTPTRWTSDGVHPAKTGTSTGAIYVAIPVLQAKLAQWAAE
jgi:hypothetical protein